MRSKKFMKGFIFGLVLIAIFGFLIQPISAYSIGGTVFNGGSYGLKDKTFDEGTRYWSVTSGSGVNYPYGRIGNCLMIKGSSSSITMNQILSAQELRFSRGRTLAFYIYFKGTQEGDIARARIRCSYRFWYWTWTNIEYGDFMAKSDDNSQQWVFLAVKRYIPSYAVEIKVELEIKNENGKSVIAYVDDAEIAIYTYTVNEEELTYYSYYRNKDDIMNINYGLSATIYEQEVLSGYHSRNQMTLSLGAFGKSEGGCLEKVNLRIEMRPKKFHEGIPIWPFDDYYYTTQDGDLNVLKLTSFNNNGFSSNQALHDLAFHSFAFSFRVLGASLAAVLITTGNPVVGVVTGYTIGFISDISANVVTDYLYGEEKPVTTKMDADGGQDYYTETTWNLKTSTYYNNKRIDMVPSAAHVENYLQWTYKAGQDYSLHIMATFYWGHYDLTSNYESFYVSNGKTTISMDLEV